MTWPDSLWAQERRAFESDDLPAAADIVIVGAGYSGLWTALALKEGDPGLDVLVIDAHEPGFGASGRNGGWCSGLFPVEADDLVRRHGETAARRMMSAMNQTVLDVERFVMTHSIDCDWARAGSITAATNPAHLRRLHESIDSAHRHGHHEVTWLDSALLSRRVNVEGALGAMYSPHCAVVHPMKLVNGLVGACRALGVRIVGGTPVRSISAGRVTTADGRTVGADWVVRATEGYTATLEGHKRSVLPLWSYMVATEPMSDAVWVDIGWDARETLADGRNMITYAQRTADGRIAFGGRGIGYRFGSRITSAESNARIHDKIIATMHELFPATRDARIEHRWGGVLGVPRDWHPSVNLDNARRIVTVGGYTGDGVAATHLAGRTAASLMLGGDDAITTLPWVGHVSPDWEPEPFRWLGVHAMGQFPTLADRIERRTQKPARRTLSLFHRLS